MNQTEFVCENMASTYFKCLIPDKALQGECGFMARNLSAKSIFGEYALANVSLEKIMARSVSL